MIFGKGKESTPTADVLDLSDEARANWMCYVRHADEASEANLELRQEGSELFFVATRAIGLGEELRLGFAREYRTKKERFFKAKTLKTLPAQPAAGLSASSSPDSFCRTCQLNFPNPILCSLHQVQHDGSVVSANPGPAPSLDVACPECSDLFPSLARLSDHVTKSHALGFRKAEEVGNDNEGECEVAKDGQAKKLETHKCQGRWSVVWFRSSSCPEGFNVRTVFVESSKQLYERSK